MGQHGARGCIQGLKEKGGTYNATEKKALLALVCPGADKYLFAAHSRLRNSNYDPQTGQALGTHRADIHQTTLGNLYCRELYDVAAGGNFAE